MNKNLLLIFFFFFILKINAQTDLSALHAPPSQAEIDAVKAEWATRDFNAYNWTVLHTGTLGIFRVDIVSHEVDGNKHYAAVRYPENYSPTGNYPVLVSNHGGASGVNVGSLNAYQADCFKSFFVALPSFRSEELRTAPIATTDYTSEGAPSEMDGDTDDALALLSGVLAIPGADASRIAVTGGSRGGGVSHLMAAKDDRISRVSVFYGATDHMSLPGLQAKMEDYVDNGGGLNPPQSNTYTYGVAPYLNGDITLAEARLILLRRSVLYFVDELPLPYQVHHGDVDPVVTVNNSQLLADEFDDQGITAPAFEYFEYAGYSHTLPPETGAPASRDAFICQLSNLNFTLDLMHFSATCDETNQSIQITFEAALSDSAALIELQWSKDQINWSTIETYDIGQNQGGQYSNAFKHESFSNGLNQYRIKVIDVSGQSTLFESVEVACGIESLQISPNPSNGLLNIQVDATALTDFPERAVIYNINGQKVLDSPLEASTVSSLDISHLSKGTYICHILVKGDWLAKRVIKL